MYTLTHIYTSIYQIKQSIIRVSKLFLFVFFFFKKNTGMLRLRDLDFDLELFFVEPIHIRVPYLRTKF